MRLFIFKKPKLAANLKVEIDKLVKVIFSILYLLVIEAFVSHHTLDNKLWLLARFQLKWKYILFKNIKCLL